VVQAAAETEFVPRAVATKEHRAGCWVAMRAAAVQAAAVRGLATAAHWAGLWAAPGEAA